MDYHGAFFPYHQGIMSCGAIEKGLLPFGHFFLRQSTNFKAYYLDTLVEEVIPVDNL